MSVIPYKKNGQSVLMFDTPQIDEGQMCTKEKKNIEQGRMLTDKLTQALNTLSPEYRKALAGGEFYTETGIAALRALRQVTNKNNLN